MHRKVWTGILVPGRSVWMEMEALQSTCADICDIFCDIYWYFSYSLTALFFLSVGHSLPYKFKLLMKQFLPFSLVTFSQAESHQFHPFQHPSLCFFCRNWEAEYLAAVDLISLSDAEVQGFILHAGLSYTTGMHSSYSKKTQQDKLQPVLSIVLYIVCSPAFSSTASFHYCLC